MQSMPIVQKSTGSLFPSPNGFRVFLCAVPNGYTVAIIGFRLVLLIPIHYIVEISKDSSKPSSGRMEKEINITYHGAGQTNSK